MHLLNKIIILLLLTININFSWADFQYYSHYFMETFYNSNNISLIFKTTPLLYLPEESENSIVNTTQWRHKVRTMSVVPVVVASCLLLHARLPQEIVPTAGGEKGESQNKGALRWGGTPPYDLSSICSLQNSW